MSSCSSLIVIVNDDYSRVVQFSHFSVKEFLTSPRLADPSRDVSRYHIDLEAAHTILAQACLGVLLRLDDRVDTNDIGERFPLVEYAARYWISHAQFNDVSTHIRTMMEYFFDPDKPHFAMWHAVYDIDTNPNIPSTFSLFRPHIKSPASPLYYAALCGFHSLVEYLVVKYPQHVNASGGYYVTPLVAAMAKKHFQTARLLCQNGADPNVRSNGERTPLHSAVYLGDVEAVQKLIEYDADVDSRDQDGNTPLFLASEGLSLKDPYVLRLLLAHGADVDARGYYGWTPLHQTLGRGSVVIASLLLEYGANVELKSSSGDTPLHNASRYGYLEATRLLLEHGANIDVKHESGETSLHYASGNGFLEVACLLLEHGANVEAKDGWGETPLLHASRSSHPAIAGLLLDHGADVEAKDRSGETSLYVASRFGYYELARVLLEHGANMEAKNGSGETPLHQASRYGSLWVAGLLLEYGANLEAKDRLGETPLHYASRWGTLEIAHLLLEYGANPEAEERRGMTPLQIGRFKKTR